MVPNRVLQNYASQAQFGTSHFLWEVDLVLCASQLLKFPAGIWQITSSRVFPRKGKKGNVFGGNGTFGCFGRRTRQRCAWRVLEPRFAMAHSMTRDVLSLQEMHTQTENIYIYIYISTCVEIEGRD